MFDSFDEETQDELREWVKNHLLHLYNLQQVLVDEIYNPAGLVEDVATFCQYNANKALMLLNQDPVFDIADDDVNRVVLNGLNTKTKDHDYFSMKNNGYQRITIEPIQDADFEF